MEALLNDAVSTVNTYLWNYLIIFILIGAGLFFTMTTGAVQIRMFKEMVRLVASGAGSKTEKNHVSSFQAFCVSTASRVGVGNIAGIAIAVVLGGPGAVFWMWVIALLLLDLLKVHSLKFTRNLLPKAVSTVVLPTISAMVLTTNS